MWLWLVLPLGFVLVGVKVHRTGLRRRPLPPDVKTGVVLGALVRPDGSATDALIDRVRVGVELLRAGHVQRLLFTGGSPDTRPTEAEVMRRIALELGAPPDALELELASRSTFDNARFTAPRLLARGETTIAVVTCDFHLTRALAQFRAHRLTPVGVPSKRDLRAADRLMVIAREVIALARRPWLLFR